MSVLTPDYERMQSLNAQQGNLRNQYKQLFKDGNIDGAQTLVNNDNAQLAMNASKLNDLVDTINYMQQFWADDKEQFTNWYLGMTKGVNNLLVHDGGVYYRYGVKIGDDYSKVHIYGQPNSVDIQLQRQIGSVDAGVNTLKSGNTYRVTGCPSSGDNATYILSVQVNFLDGLHEYYHDTGSGVEFTLSRDAKSFTMSIVVNIQTTDPIDVTFIPRIYSTSEIYDPTQIYHTGTIVLYSNDALPYFCISDNTTGTWDSSKWILLKPNETGLNFIGEYDSTTSYNTGDLVWSNNNNIIEWKYYDGADFIVVATTYPNIKYLSDTTQAIDGEVYITDYREGV